MSKTVADMLAEANAQIETISPQQASDELAAGKAVFLDIREPVEWEHHIGDAVQVPRGLLEFVADPTSPKHNEAFDPSRRWIVYCRSGARAALACATLKTLGYKDVANLQGGFNAWRDAGLPSKEHHEGI